MHNQFQDHNYSKLKESRKIKFGFMGLNKYGSCTKFRFMSLEIYSINYHFTMSLVFKNLSRGDFC